MLSEVCFSFCLSLKGHPFPLKPDAYDWKYFHTVTSQPLYVRACLVFSDNHSLPPQFPSHLFFSVVFTSEYMRLSALPFASAVPSSCISAVGKYKTLKERGRKCWFCNDTGGRTILTANLAMAFFLRSQAESLYNISVIGASEGLILIKPSLSWIMHLWTLSLQAGDKAFI